MGLEEDAVAIAAGELAVVEVADVLDIAAANPRRAVAVACSRTDEWCTVFFVIKQTDGDWRTEIVPVRRGEINSYGGGTGGMVRRSQVQPGRPFCEGEFRTSIGDGTCLVSTDGVSADDAVRMLSGNQVVAEAIVAAHGYFVLSAVLQEDAEVTIEAA